MSDEPTQKNRRAFPRRIGKGKIKVTCHKGTMDLGPNLAVKLVDVSEDGLRLNVKTALEKGQEVCISVEGPRQLRPVKLPGKVVWAQPNPDGTHLLGIQFEKRMAYKELLEMT